MFIAHRHSRWQWRSTYNFILCSHPKESTIWDYKICVVSSFQIDSRYSLLVVNLPTIDFAIDVNCSFDHIEPIKMHSHSHSNPTANIRSDMEAYARIGRIVRHTLPTAEVESWRTPDKPLCVWIYKPNAMHMLTFQLIYFFCFQFVSINSIGNVLCRIRPHK